jgi:hypothetical protein
MVRSSLFPTLADEYYIVQYAMHIMSLKSTIRSKKSITMDPEIETKARKIQARLIEKTDKT